MYVIIPFVMFMVMVILGQEKGNEVFLLYSCVPMILAFFGIICQEDIATRKKEVKWIFNK